MEKLHVIGTNEYGMPIKFDLVPLDKVLGKPLVVENSSNLLLKPLDIESLLDRTDCCHPDNRGRRG